MSSGPLVVLIVGMAGTGKTTLVQRINHYAVERKSRSYFVNLDPAVNDVPFAANIDIRDTVNYKEVMRQFRLGPNGAIISSLNLFATNINQVIQIIEKKRDTLDYVFVDTPGQIEVFTWSASGQIICEAFGSTFPTTVLFVADTTRCANPQTFMSTMLYSCSILYKTQLPLVVVLNKCDVVGGEGVVRWMKDPDALAQALKKQKSYAATLTESLSLFMNEFYRNLHYAAVSALTGSGIDELHEALAAARKRYNDEFLPMMQRKQEAKTARLAESKANDTKKLAEDAARAVDDD